MKKIFEELMRNKEKPLGIFMNCGCPEFLESAGLAGYQFVIIDNEHGGWSGETNAHILTIFVNIDIILSTERCSRL